MSEHLHAFDFQTERCSCSAERVDMVRPEDVSLSFVPWPTDEQVRRLVDFLSPTRAMRDIASKALLDKGREAT